jgi:hypothetical protein
MIPLQPEKRDRKTVKVVFSPLPNSTVKQKEGGKEGRKGGRKEGR